MKKLFWIGIALVLAGLAILILGNRGDGISVAAILGGGVLFVIGGTMALFARAVTRSIARAEGAVGVLLDRGVRRTGTVADIVVEPTFVVVKIDLDRTGGGTGERVNCFLVDDRETARSLIGKPITIVEHPEDRTLRAIDGYLPNGLKRPAARQP
jgi:hypothetical protein